MNIPFIKDGEAIPCGLSKHAYGYRLKFPIWTKTREGYDWLNDEFVRDRFSFQICVRTELSGFAVHWARVRIRKIGQALA